MVTGVSKSVPHLVYLLSKVSFYAWYRMYALVVGA